MSAYANVIQGRYVALVSAVRNATQTIVGASLMDAPVNNTLNPSSGINPEASGLVAYLNVTAVPGVDTVQLVLEEQDPASTVWSQLLATTATAVTGMVRLKLKPAIAAVAPSTTLVQGQDILSGIWRVRVVHSGAGNFTYSLGVVLYN